MHRQLFLLDTSPGKVYNRCALAFGAPGSFPPVPCEGYGGFHFSKSQALRLEAPSIPDFRDLPDRHDRGSIGGLVLPTG
jgi:hypothetical protein